jgi:hypothetical protein
MCPQSGRGALRVLRRHAACGDNTGWIADMAYKAKRSFGGKACADGQLVDGKLKEASSS